MVNTIAINILIFVSWKTGPACWQRVAPGFFYCLMLFMYIIMPVVNLLAFLGLSYKNGKDVFKSMYESWVIFYMVIQVSKVITYFVTIRGTWLKEARVQLAEKRLLEQDEAGTGYSATQLLEFTETKQQID